MHKAEIGPPPLKARPVRCLASSEVILESAWKSFSLCQPFRYIDRGLMLITSQEMNQFHNLLEVREVKEFLSRDYCRTHADNYLLSMVFVYFKRAHLQLVEYCPRYFWLALYLAHDQEEEEEQLKWEILPWALGPNWPEKKYTFYDYKFSFWKRMNYRSAVSRKQCDQIMNLAQGSHIWRRIRHESHGGAIRQVEGQIFHPSGPLIPASECYRCPQQFYYVNQELEEDNFPIFGNRCSSQEISSNGDPGIFNSSKDTKRIMLTCTEKEVSLLKQTLAGLNILKSRMEEDEFMFLSVDRQNSKDEGYQIFGSQNSNSSQEINKNVNMGTLKTTADELFPIDVNTLREEDESIFLSDEEESIFLSDEESPMI